MSTINLNTIHLDLQLEKLKVACQQSFTSEFLMDARLDSFADEITNNMHMRLVAFVWGTPEKSFTHSVPASAWEHFKLDYAPKWFVKRYPIKLIKTVYHVREVFPDYKVLNEKSTMWIRTARLMPF